MPLNRDFVGRRFVADTSFLVGREHIRQFALAIGEDSPLCYDLDAAKSAGYVDLVAPPTFLTALSMWRPVIPTHDPTLGLDYSLVVHGEQQYSLRRPVVAGDEIMVSGTVTDIRNAGRNELLISDYEFVTTAGEVVAAARASLVSRGTAMAEKG
ncbi:FAS1-like dehydratase domain-containing protein [Frankia sp. Cas3]|uniref:FAS1-like dehydratase domain-containing protein n=1 Tax=Frankia sp. Cas3 TaxID=3073926 RepID=UPI002AD36BCD|nr:MaoC family dehydratase N-terminal domain-containing protein [Frankia sp. Cas3]